MQLAQNTSEKKALNYKLTRNWTNYLFLAPGVLFLIFFMVFPIIYNIVLSFQDVSLLNFKGVKHFIGLENYRTIFKDPVFFIALKNSVFFTVGCIFFQFSFGFAFALLFNMNFPGRNILRALMILAWMLPGIISATLFKWILSGDSGILNYFLQSLRIIDKPILWLTDTDTSLLGTMVANIWHGIPFNMLILLGGLQSLPEQLFEASKLDGASRYQRFVYITLPLMRPTILILLMLGIIYAFKVFDLIFIMTAGGPVNSSFVLPFYAFNQTFVQMEFSLGGTVATLMLVFLSMVAVVYLWFLKKEEKVH